MNVSRRGRGRQPGEGDVVSQGVAFQTETAQTRSAGRRHGRVRAVGPDGERWVDAADLYRSFLTT